MAIPKIHSARIDEHLAVFDGFDLPPPWIIENALAAECLLRMSVYSKRQHLRDTGLLVLSGCLDKYRHTGIQGATYACVVAQAVIHKWL